jgi:lysyl-tRNA synthetase class 2
VRRNIAELAGLPAATRVCIAGRVLVSEPSGFMLSDQSGWVLCTAARLPAELSLVMVEGTWDGHDVVCERFLHEQPGSVRPLADAEHASLTGKGGARGRARQERLFARAALIAEVRRFFHERSFLEVETPLAVPSPGLDLHLSALELKTSKPARYLITSPEYQMKRLLAGGLERIVQIGKCFRDDEIGERHQPEFTMVEWYRAWADVEAVMRDTEELVAHVAEARSGRRVLLTAQGEIDVTPPWPRLTVREAFARYAGLGLDDVVSDETRFYRVLVEQVEPALTELGAVFLCEYPASMASLARKKPGDPRVAERFEAYVGGIELCNGFGELTDAQEQRSRLLHDQAERARLGLPVYPIDERFLGALEEGIPPSAGNALGLDRLIMLALGAAHIEDVLAIPASKL